MGLDSGEEGLGTEQQLVLRTIYDRFRKYRKWPTLISVDRPLRREHGIRLLCWFAEQEMTFTPRMRVVLDGDGLQLAAAHSKLGMPPVPSIDRKIVE